MVNRDNILREYAIVRDENIKLKADNERLLNALHNLVVWKEGTINYVTAYKEAEEIIYKAKQ